ncbi:MAG: extracellular solute-binding protein [Caldilineaceae bacterium]
MAWQFGGAYSDPDFYHAPVRENTIAAGEFYKSTVHDYGWARPSKDIGADFINGLTAAAMMSTGSMGGLKDSTQFEFGTAFLPKKENYGCCWWRRFKYSDQRRREKRMVAMHYIGFVSNTENTTFWAQNTGYMPVRKSAVASEAMQAYFAEFPQFQTAVEQLPLTQPQDSARVWVPNGDQIIGAGLERITVSPKMWPPFLPK